MVSYDEYNDPVIFSPRQLVSSSRLSKGLGGFLDTVKKWPIFVTRDNEVEAVLISVNDYRALLEEERQVEELYHAVLALRRLVEYRLSGETAVDMDDVLARYGLTRDELADE